MTPAMRFGNWLREVLPCLKRHTTPLKEEEELTVIDEIVLHTINNYDVKHEGIEKKQIYILIGDLKLSRPFGLGARPLVEYKGEYKGEYIGFCENKSILRQLDSKVMEYNAKMIRAREPEDVKRKQDEAARLAQILKEVKGRG